MASLLKKVKSKMFIASYRKATHALEGEYLSLMKGRSMDFDDLREYVTGDDVKDIDWKASARHTTPLVKRYIANRKQPVYFVVDAGLNMKALSGNLEQKQGLVIDIMGVLGYLAVKHSDTVGLIVGDVTKTVRVPQRETESHLERILELADNAIETSENDGDIHKQLQYVVNTVKSKGLVVVIADEIELNESFDSLLRKVKASHELLWISVSDGNPLNISLDENVEVQDIETGESIPAYLRRLHKVVEAVEVAEISRRENTEHYLRRLRISHATISQSSETIPVLLKLLERRLRERRR